MPNAQSYMREPRQNSGREQLFLRLLELESYVAAREMAGRKSVLEQIESAYTLLQSGVPVVEAEHALEKIWSNVRHTIPTAEIAKC